MTFRIHQWLAIALDYRYDFLIADWKSTSPRAAVIRLLCCVSCRLSAFTVQQYCIMPRSRPNKQRKTALLIHEDGFIEVIDARTVDPKEEFDHVRVTSQPLMCAQSADRCKFWEGGRAHAFKNQVDATAWIHAGTHRCVWSSAVPLRCPQLPSTIPHGTQTSANSLHASPPTRLQHSDRSAIVPCFALMLHCSSYLPRAGSVSVSCWYTYPHASGGACSLNMFRWMHVRMDYPEASSTM